MFIYYTVILFFVTFGDRGFLFDLSTLAFAGLALDPGAFERLDFFFFSFGDVEATTTFWSGGELLSGQVVNTLTSLTF